MDQPMENLATENLLEVSDLHFAYGQHKVLKGINLTIPRGKVVAILGVSGCGKTTLLRHFGGQLRPSRGSVKFMGKVVHELGNDDLYLMRREMGMMFQVSGLFSDLSVYDNLAFPMREHTDLSEEMIHDLVLMKLHAVGLRSAHALMPSELSGGMERRVALARAIALDPALIIYDEPFAGLFPEMIKIVVAIVKNLRTQGQTVILVEHNMDLIRELSDYLIVLDSGKLFSAKGPSLL